MNLIIIGGNDIERSELAHSVATQEGLPVRSAEELGRLGPMAGHDPWVTEAAMLDRRERGVLAASVDWIVDMGEDLSGPSGRELNQRRRSMRKFLDRAWGTRAHLIRLEYTPKQMWFERVIQSIEGSSDIAV